MDAFTRIDPYYVYTATIGICRDTRPSSRPRRRCGKTDDFERRCRIFLERTFPESGRRKRRRRGWKWRPSAAANPRRQPMVQNKNKLNRVQTTNAFWRSASVLVSEMFFKWYSSWCYFARNQPISQKFNSRVTDGRMDRRTDRHTLLKRCENASKQDRIHGTKGA